eukprot:PhM_4_TR14878/c1_g1_i1/m.30144
MSQCVDDGGSFDALRSARSLSESLVQYVDDLDKQCGEKEERYKYNTENNINNNNADGMGAQRSVSISRFGDGLDAANKMKLTRATTNSQTKWLYSCDGSKYADMWTWLIQLCNKTNNTVDNNNNNNN